MITLHHLRIGRSLFTAWLLEEVEVDYQLKVYLRNPETMRAPPELKEVHPLGKSPIIEDDGLMLTESGAITSYVLSKFDTAHKLHPNQDDLAVLIRSGVDHPVIAPFSNAEIKLHFDHISTQLGNNDYILGNEFTGADFGIAYVVSMAERLGQLDGYPKLKTYVQRCMSRPAFQRAIERAVE